MRIQCIAALLFSLGILSAQETTYNLINLELNNEKPHFGLTISPDGKAVLTSFLLTKKGKIAKIQGNTRLTLYEGRVDQDGQLVAVEPLVKDAHIGHITSAAFSPDGTKLYIATNYGARKDKPKGASSTNYHIEVGEFIAGKGWTNFKVLPFCKTRFSYAHPNISPDGKTMYFTANIKGSGYLTRGPSDIFRVSINEDGSYGKPENLGSRVNSYSREMFPYMANDSTLYFASNRPNGAGGYDIYKSVMNADGSFEKAVILPKPLNSNKDEVCFLIFEDGTGYLSSKRGGGKGDDDIYFFEGAE